MKGIFDAYVPQPFNKKLILVANIDTPDYTVKKGELLHDLKKGPQSNNSAALFHKVALQILAKV